MRRFRWLSLLGVLVLAACGQASEPTEVTSSQGLHAQHPHSFGRAEGTSARNDLLFLGSGTGVTVFDPATTSATLDARPAVPSQQGNVVFRTVPRAGGTEVTALDPETGAVRWSQQLNTTVELRVASADGTAAVVGPVRPADGAIAARTQTVLTVVREQSTREFVLDGNYEPEAFAPDGSRLFLIQYLPAEAPDRYTLRLLDVATGALEEVYDAHGGAREPMQGTARTHVYSPDGTRLYTYYQIVGEPYVEAGKPPFYAFVHVLDLAAGWAHCVDLTPPFGTGDAIAPAMAVSDDGSRVYVADPRLGQLAAIDADRLEVVGIAGVAEPATRESAAATFADGSLVLAFDGEVMEVDADELEVTSSFSVPSPVSALQSGPDGRVFVALFDRVDVYDRRSGERLGEVVAGAGPFTYADPARVPIDATRDVVKCAC
jgi:outer membrane protein assembly factor BamB